MSKQKPGTPAHLLLFLFFCPPRPQQQPPTSRSSFFLPGKHQEQIGHPAICLPFHKHGEHLTPWPRPCTLATLLLHQWDVLAIVGPSGTGKSTLLEILVDRLSPSPVPELLLLDGAAAASPDLRRVFGYVTQRDVLFPLLTVREALLFSPRLRLGATLPVPAKDMHARVDALLHDLTLRRAATIKDLSGGERRRVSIGVEAVHDPAVLITSGLDSASALQIVGALRALAETRGHTAAAVAGLSRGRKEGRRQWARRRRGRAATPDWGPRADTERRRGFRRGAARR